ncbi:MAG: caspase family protein [Bacteroidetes bacterium]|nr:caspase family protein [Bacteroidota bacterium]
MKKALIVGVGYHENKALELFECVSDAKSVESVLSKNSDGTSNFDTTLMVADYKAKITRKELKKSVIKLFEDDSDVALFYFSGHGYVEDTGGYLITSECKDGDDGFPLTELLQLANNSPAKNRIIVLDCCYAGFAGKLSGADDKSILSEGLTILAASKGTQPADTVENELSIFTRLFVDALNGGASNLLGEITLGSVYAHIDKSLGPWEQRPIFKANVQSFINLRKVTAPISFLDLKEIVNLFPKKEEPFQLNPTFEPTEQSYIPENGKKFALLQKYNRLNLVVPIDEDHMYYAAMNSKTCQLTVLGKHYWNLVNEGRIYG